MLRELAEYRKKILIGAILGIIITAGIAVSASWSASSDASTSGIDSASARASTQLIVELTDPATVPAGTTSLNLTYSQIVLSVTLASGSPQSIVLVSGGESAVNLLGLDNLSQTVALGQIESGSQVLSATFLESNMEIGINGTNYPVILATGGNALPVDITDPPQINGTENVLLLDMSPTGDQLLLWISARPVF